MRAAWDGTVEHGEAAVEERTVAFPARSFLRASQNGAMEERIATVCYALQEEAARSANEEPWHAHRREGPGGNAADCASSSRSRS